MQAVPLSPKGRMRRRHLAILLGLGISPFGRAAEATLNLLVPWPAGGAVDSAARSLQPELSRLAGMPVLIENIPGAGGLIALERYARRPLAERGLLVGTNSDLIASLLSNAGTTTRLRPEDFRLVGMLAIGGFVLLAREGLAVRDFDGLVAHARALPPQTLTFAHGGSGSLFHLAWEELCARTGITALQVPYKGAPEMLRDLANGQLDLAFAPLTTASIAFPGVRALGITAPTRHPLFPRLPTLAESQAARDYRYEGWFALAVLRDTPAAELARFERWAQAAVQAPAFIESARQAGGLPPPALTRTELDQFFDAEISRHRRLIQRLGL